VNGQAAVSVTPQFVYAANGDANTISAYSVDANSGALTKISDLTTDASPGIVAADPYGRFVYVAHAYDNAITAYSIDSTGALHKLSDVSADDATLPGPSVLVVDPSGRFVYAGYVNANKIQAYVIDASTGNLKSAGLFLTQSGISSAAIDPLGLFIYAASVSSNVISTWRIDVNTGSLVAVDGMATAADSFGITAIDPFGRYLYVASGDASVVIHTYAIEASSGQLVDVSVASTAADHVTPQVSSLVIDPSGKFAYVAVHSSDDSYSVLSTYSISAAGVLTKVNDMPFGSADAWQGPFAIDPSGRYAYAFLDLGSTGTGSVYSIDAITGALSKVSDLSVWKGWPTSAVVTGMTQ